MTIPLYDSIGLGYSKLRVPDPRIARRLQAGLGSASSVLNVGAGCGSYEPLDRKLVAAELSRTMIAQRPKSAAPAVQANSEHLPFRTNAFDASMAVLTLHHWSDLEAGLGEMQRVASERVAILTWDPQAPNFWLYQYFPELLEIDQRIFPTLDSLQRILGSCQIHTVPIPFDCSDGFLGAYWRRPSAYLDAGIRTAISTFSKIEKLQSGLTQLQADLESGAWEQQFGPLLAMEEFDIGYRLVCTQ